MTDRHLRIGSCLILLLLTAVPVHGQEPTWGLRAFAYGGANFPVRNLGKNAVEIQEQAALQVVAEMETSPAVGGGLEYLFPDRDMRIRAHFMTTVGATARGVLGLCESGKLAVPGEGLCALDLTTDARIVDGHAELVFATGDPGRWIRPLIWFGAGIRSIDFESDQLVCDEFGNETSDAYQICRRSREILENPSINPSLNIGLGLEADRDPVSAFVRVSMVTVSYTGGTGLADGSRQMDLGVTAGLAFKVR
jgi:hypothetical protein